MKKLVSLLTSCLILSSPLLSSAENDLLNYENKGELLGIASQFAAFVEEDFGANGSDCEGKIFVGGSANLGTATWYSAARVGAEASVIVQGEVLKNFDTGDRIFVVGEDTDVQIESKHVIRGNVIDTEKEFAKLREVSTNLSTQECTAPRLGEWNQELQFVGTDSINYFELPQLDSCNYYFNYNVPYDSYVIVNVSGKHPVLHTQLYGCSYAGERISNNKDSKSKYILFNLYEAETFKIEGTGTFYGTILAPNALGYDDMTYGAHETGSLIAKSYFGGIEFGGIGFDLKEEKEPEPKEEVATKVTSEKETEIPKQEDKKETVIPQQEEKVTQITKQTSPTQTGTAAIIPITSSAATTKNTSTTTRKVSTKSTKQTNPSKQTTTKKIVTTQQTNGTAAGTKQVTTTSGTINPKTSGLFKNTDWRTIIFLIIVIGAVLGMTIKNRKGG